MASKKLTDEQRKAKIERIKQRNDPSCPFPRDLNEASDDQLGYTSAGQTFSLAFVKMKDLTRKWSSGAEIRAAGKAKRNRVICDEIDAYFERSGRNKINEAAIHLKTKVAPNKTKNPDVQDEDKSIWLDIAKLSTRQIHRIYSKSKK